MLVVRGGRILVVNPSNLYRPLFSLKAGRAC